MVLHVLVSGVTPLLTFILEQGRSIHVEVRSLLRLGLQEGPKSGIWLLWLLMAAPQCVAVVLHTQMDTACCLQQPCSFSTLE